MNLTFKYLSCSIFCCLLTAFFAPCANAQIGNELLLNGEWKWGYKRSYNQMVTVPGLVTEPGKINQDTIWLKREVELPAGKFNSATLVLKGARFNPIVYVNNKLVAATKGGMAPVEVHLDKKIIKPRRTFTLEIGLVPLSKVEADNASKIPDADLWRSNVSSGIWDDVLLHLHQKGSFERLFVFSRFNEDEAVLRYNLNDKTPKNSSVIVNILNSAGQIIASAKQFNVSDSGDIRVPLKKNVIAWSPENPNLYRAEVTLFSGNKVYDKRSLLYGHKDFKVNGLQFELNNQPVKLRAASVVWHRWVRDPEARELAWDTVWFKKNIVDRLKQMGANTLRFHLGSPPERFLELCDRYGLMVQAEWPFFHGMKSSEQSLEEQWPDWFDLCMKHPSVVLLHPWNETENEKELEIAFGAIKTVSAQYPPLVISHRDVLHIHKYWWSLFENLGLYYDSYKQFPQPVMADEFGGNYLDGQANMGAYPMVRPAFERFLGRKSTPQQRLTFQAMANGKVAEYWRRIGVAGFSPFVVLSSPEDGNHWFMGPLKDGNPKPVWEALKPAFAQKSISLELWDKNFIPGQPVSIPLHFFNDTGSPVTHSGNVEVIGNGNKTALNVPYTQNVGAFGHEVRKISFNLPKENGEWRVQAKLNSAGSHQAIESEWNVRTMVPVVSTVAKNRVVAVSKEDQELRRFLQNYGFKVVSEDNKKASVFISSAQTWQRMQNDQAFKAAISDRIDKKQNVILLDAGPSKLGQGYREDGSLGPLQGVEVVTNGKKETVSLPYGVNVAFEEVAEPESHIHPADQDSSLWKNLPLDATRLWNGLRAGLIVPAAGMEMTGLNAAAFLKDWQNKGADTAQIKKGNYYAYELQGFYAFANSPADSAVLKKLRAHVFFLVEDAPSLKFRVNPDAPIITHNLYEGYQKGLSSKADAIVPLALAGNELKRTPVFMISYGAGRGKMIISQLITKNRLAPQNQKEGLYDIRFDPAAVQMVLNMIDKVVTDQ